MNAEQLAREICKLANAEHMGKHGRTIEVNALDAFQSAIAARLAPLVRDAEKYRKLMEINDRMQKCMRYDD